MIFSEYTLISFGDSFTFGQDTIPDYIRQRHGQTEIQEKYKKECNEKSYTQVLCDRLGFKNSLNFGILAGSNERSLTLLESFLRSNPKKKVFVLFNFTDSSRFLNYLKVDDKREYEATNIQSGSFDSPSSFSEDRYTGITKRSLNTLYTYWRNSVQDVYSHIKDRRHLYYLLSSFNTPHVSFDILNTTDSHMLRDNPLDYIHSDDGFGIDFMYNDDERYVFKEMDFFKSYHKELVDKSPLLTHMGIDYLSGQRNIKVFINTMAKDNHNDSDYYISEYGKHWNIEGHCEVAKLIEKFINEKYDN